MSAPLGLPDLHELSPATDLLRTVLVSPKAPSGVVHAETNSGTTVPRGNQTQGDRPTRKELEANPPTEGGRNEWLTRLAGHFAHDHGNSRAEFDKALRGANGKLAEPLSQAEVSKIAESIWSRQKAKPDDEAKESPTVRVINFLRCTYDFFATTEGEVFAMARQGHRRPIIMGENGTGQIKARVTADLFELDGKVTSSAAIEDALRVIYSQTSVQPNTLDLSLRVAERPGMIVLDLAEPGTSRCVVVTGAGWEVRPEPPEGVLFRLTRTTKPLPEPQRGGATDQLRHLLDWEATDPRWQLVSGWLVAAFFGSIPRPLLAFVGQPGSGKTTVARLILCVIDPRNELGSSFGKNEGDEQVMAANRYLVGWDNISRATDDVSDRLCRVVTGEESVKRKLYTNQDQEVISYRRTGAITAVTIPNLRADALERLIMVGCDRIDGRNRRSESKIREDFDEHHPQILGGLLDDLVLTLENLRASRERDTSRVRMADFQDVLHALDPALAVTYADSVRTIMVDAAEADPFVSAVTDWLATQSLPLTLQASAAWHEASEFRGRLSPDDPAQWWPKSAPAFSTLLKNNAEPLHALGIQVDHSRKTKAGRQLVFFAPGQSEETPLEGLEQ